MQSEGILIDVADNQLLDENRTSDLLLICFLFLQIISCRSIMAVIPTIGGIS
jgi:hypothetical protein